MIVKKDRTKILGKIACKFWSFYQSGGELKLPRLLKKYISLLKFQGLPQEWQN